MCEKILDRIPALTAEERLQLRENCQRAKARAKDRLIVLEAQRILDALDARQRREARALARLPAARRIEFAFRRLPADDGERQVLRMLASRETGWSLGERQTDDAAPAAAGRTWHRKIGEICRMRRHLLCPDAGQTAEQAAADATARAEAAPWALPLLAVDEGTGDIRLRPEAIGAFARLGYVANDSGARVLADGGSRSWAAAG